MDEIVLVSYFIALSILFIFGLHGFLLLYYHHKYKSNISESQPELEEAPLVTVQLPLFNEYYVVLKMYIGYDGSET